MAHKIIHVSKHIVVRVILGVLTGVVGFSIIYFLGFNRAPSKVPEVEIRKNTITTWKSYVQLENSIGKRRDSLYTKLTKNFIGIREYRAQDSVLGDQFISGLESLKKTKDIDKLLYIMLGARIRYKKSARENYINFYDKYVALQDSSVDASTKNYLIQGLNLSYTYQNNNILERIGHTNEDMANALAKKYKYGFSIAEFGFNTYYQNLKTFNRQEWIKYITNNTVTAPVDPARARQD